MKKSIFISASVLALISTTGMAAEKPAMPAGQPQKNQLTAAIAKEPQKAEQLSGKVLETMNSGTYSYILIEKNDGKKVWIAVPETQVKVGSQMSFKPGAEMRNFESKSLKRNFSSIIFSDGVAGATTKASKPAATDSSAPTARTTTALESKISVKKATGANAITIEKAYSDSDKLDKQKVVIRGKVIKISSGIMGKNWIHLQDGTGSREKGNYDLTCTTTSDLPDVGSIITVTGTLAKNRDFGAGYFYTVILEDVKFKK